MFVHGSWNSEKIVRFSSTISLWLNFFRESNLLLMVYKLWIITYDNLLYIAESSTSHCVSFMLWVKFVMHSSKNSTFMGIHVYGPKFVLFSLWLKMIHCIHFCYRKLPRNLGQLIVSFQSRVDIQGWKLIMSEKISVGLSFDIKPVSQMHPFFLLTNMNPKSTSVHEHLTNERRVLSATHLVCTRSPSE